MGKWTEISAGALNASQQRFWAALGDDADSVANRINVDPDYLAIIVATAQKELKLLEPTGVSLLIPACGKFIAAEKLVIDTSETARVRISNLGDNFKEWFGEKVEENFAEAELKLSKLRKKSVDKPIMDELGEKCEISLYGFHETLAHKQAKGDLSLTIGYALDVEGVRRAVHARWNGDGWYVSTSAVGSPGPWRAGSDVVSR